MRTQKITGAVLLMTLCAAAALAVTPVERAQRDSRISVTTVGGEVDVTMAGAAVEVRPNSDVTLPARVVTGHDGTLGITQAGTNITVSNDTDIEIPAEAVDGNLVARLVQHRGNVFYDVAPRDTGKLRVETPLLVAVIKGTQFNVAVQQDSTTISLFEGRLEIRTPDGSEVIELNAGEIAIRSRVDETIRVVGMNDDRVAAARPAARPAVDARAQVDMPSLNVQGGERVADVAVRTPGADSKPSPGLPGGDAAVAISGGLTAANVAVTTSLDAAVAKVDAGIGANIDLAAGRVDVGLDTGVDVAGVGADIGLDAALDLGGGNVDVGLDTGVTVGGASADLGLDTAIDLGAGSVDLGANAGLDLGGTTADLGLDTTLDLGGSPSIDLDTDVDVGGLVDLGLDAGLDLGNGTLDLDADLNLGGTVDLVLDTTTDLGNTLDLGATLDLSGSTTPPAGGGSAPAPPPPPPLLPRVLGGLLGL